jgi:hypothetical protein
MEVGSAAPKQIADQFTAARREMPAHHQARRRSAIGSHRGANPSLVLGSYLATWESGSCQSNEAVCRC